MQKKMAEETYSHIGRKMKLGSTYASITGMVHLSSRQKMDRSKESSSIGGLKNLMGMCFRIFGSKMSPLGSTSTYMNYAVPMSTATSRYLQTFKTLTGMRQS